MGIAGLLKFLENASTSTNIKDKFSGSTGAVDISHWIYKACYACPELLYRREMDKVNEHIRSYIMAYVNLLKSYNIKLIFVFDGMKVPAKKITHVDRDQRKKECREKIELFLKQDNKEEARKLMCRCLDIKFDTVQFVINLCKKENIKFIVAPYEADAQLGYLSRTGLCDFVITEDADLVLYGCDFIVFKLDKSTGQCVILEKSKINKCIGSNIEFSKFRRIAIMSGCDYLKNISGVGLQSAKKFFSLTKNNDLKTLLPKLSSYLQSPKLAGKVTQEYVDGFIAAENTFKYHIVYCPKQMKLVPLEPYPNGNTCKNYPSAGKIFDSEIATDIAEGKMNLDDLDPDTDLDCVEDIGNDTQTQNSNKTNISNQDPNGLETDLLHNGRNDEPDLPIYNHNGDKPSILINDQDSKKPDIPINDHINKKIDSPDQDRIREETDSSKNDRNGVKADLIRNNSNRGCKHGLDIDDLINETPLHKKLKSFTSSIFPMNGLKF